MWRAKNLGGEEHLHWSTDTYLLAAILDAVNTQLKGKKLKANERVERPAAHKVKKYKPKSVAEMDFGVLFGES